MISLSIDLFISLSLSLSLSLLSLHHLFYFVLRTLKQLETALQRSEVLDMTLKDEKKNAAILKKEMLGKIEDVRKTSDVLLQRREKELTKENDRKEYATFQKYLNDQLVSVFIYLISSPLNESLAFVTVVPDGRSCYSLLQ